MRSVSAVSVRAGEPAPSLAAGSGDAVAAGSADAEADGSLPAALGLVRSAAHPATIVHSSMTVANAPAEGPFIDAS